MNFLNLGATLYVPGSHKDIISIANKHKIPNIRSVVFCTEDSISESELEFALKNINFALNNFKKVNIMRFIRPRNPLILSKILDMSGINMIDGFVLPKISLNNIELYFKILKNTRFSIMLTLEDADVFCYDKLSKLCDMIIEKSFKERVLALRIGGLDLLNLLGIRRSCDRTIYDTPIGNCIDQCVSIFKPCGFNLCAPAFECFDSNEILLQEVDLDLLHGLFGKTAVHPGQIEIIESAYKVSVNDFETANSLLDFNMPAVFNLHGRMCEKATHSNWAQHIIAREKIYGVKDVQLNNMYDISSNSFLNSVTL